MENGRESPAASRRALALAACLGITVCLGARAAGQTTQTRPAGPSPSAAATDEAVQAAIARAVKYLYSRQDAQGAFPNRHSGEYVGGGEALVALALLNAGEDPADGRLRRLLGYLKGLQPGQTYTRCVRAMVFSLLGEEDARRSLGEDVRWLLNEQQRNGGWGYGPRSAMTRLRPEWTDSSNSQFAVLALREASDAGAPVPLQNWVRAESYWRRSQNSDGGWGYQPPGGEFAPQRPESHGSMTAAGLASYLIFSDRIGPSREEPFELGKARRQGERAFANEIDRALSWLTDNYAFDRIPKYVWMVQPGQLYYYLFCLLRVGNEAGLRSIGPNDYPAQVASLLLSTQKADGSWDSSVIDTAFALLSLARARAPIAMNRLVLDEAPAADPRDAANVARWLSREWGTPMAWQQLSPPMTEALNDSLVLYINSPAQPALPQALAGPFKDFIRNGGTCLVQARPDDPKSPEALQQYFQGLFADYQGQEVSAEHPIFRLRYRIQPTQQPRILGIGDRCRTRIFILAEDVSGAWHQDRSRQERHLFELAGNIVLYAAGGAVPPGRLAARARAAPAPPARKSIGVARLKYDGDYDVCPLAVSRLSDALRRSLSIGLKELPAVDVSGPIDPAVRLLWLTGNVPPQLSAAQQANLRKYLEEGGTLLIDPATGRADFRQAASQLLAEMFGPERLQALPRTSPLITGDFAGGIGADASRARLLHPPPASSASQSATQPGGPALAAVYIAGRIAVVLSGYGLTCSIEGTPCCENVGYDTENARRLALNVILYAATAGR